MVIFLKLEAFFFLYSKPQNGWVSSRSFFFSSSNFSSPFHREEIPICYVKAAVYYFNLEQTSWEPVDNGISAIYVYQSPIENTYRVVGICQETSRVCYSLSFLVFSYLLLIQNDRLLSILQLLKKQIINNLHSYSIIGVIV